MTLTEGTTMTKTIPTTTTVDLPCGCTTSRARGALMRWCLRHKMLWLFDYLHGAGAVVPKRRKLGNKL